MHIQNCVCNIFVDLNMKIKYKIIWDWWFNMKKNRRQKKTRASIYEISNKFKISKMKRHSQIIKINISNYTNENIRVSKI